MTGLIIRALSGFYYVETAQGEVACRARGRFRKENCTPLVGDRVEITTDGKTGMVEAILPRDNCFVRPALANVGLLVIFASNAIPVTEPFLIDRVTAIAGAQKVPVLILINKTDLAAPDSLAEIYRRAGYEVLCTSAETGEGVDELRRAIAGKTVAFTGNSGVGKSSILNRLAPDLAVAVGEVSEKLGRGRHTTRHVELYSLPDGTRVADTPGFSSFDTDRMELVLEEQLADAFPEFAPFLGGCQFDDCAHNREPGCAVREAVERGEIPKSRYESYLRLYEKAKEVPEWERKKP